MTGPSAVNQAKGLNPRAPRFRRATCSPRSPRPRRVEVGLPGSRSPAPTCGRQRARSEPIDEQMRILGRRPTASRRRSRYQARAQTQESAECGGPPGRMLLVPGPALVGRRRRDYPASAEPTILAGAAVDLPSGAASRSTSVWLTTARRVPSSVHRCAPACAKPSIGRVHAHVEQHPLGGRALDDA